MADEFRRTLDQWGWGGVKCHCCNLYPTKQEKLRRIVRARLKELDQKRLKEELNATNES